MACVGGDIDVDWLVLAAACCVSGLVSGGGGAGGGVWASLWVVWVLRVCAVWPLRFLTGFGAGV